MENLLDDIDDSRHNAATDLEKDVIGLMCSVANCYLARMNLPMMIRSTAIVGFVHYIFHLVDAGLAGLMILGTMVSTMWTMSNRWRRSAATMTRLSVSIYWKCGCTEVHSFLANFLIAVVFVHLLLKFVVVRGAFFRYRCS